MAKIMEFMKKRWAYLIGGIVGGIGGYLYWYYIGCSSGTCPITSSPLMSTIWGVLLGSLLFSMVFSIKSTQAAKVNIKELLDKGALLLDVRTRSEYAGGHVKNSKNIPLDELADSLHQLDKEQHIVVVCASGMRSAQAVSLMKRNGFQNSYNGGSWVKYKHHDCTLDLE